LIAAAGISGAGLGGAAALGLLKMTDKLLQGEKFSTAVGKGAETGAMAYAAGQIGKAMRGDQAPVDSKGTDALSAQWEKQQSDTAKYFLKHYTPNDFEYVPNGMQDINIINKATGKLAYTFSVGDMGPAVDSSNFIADMGKYGKAASSAASKAARDAADTAFDKAYPNFESTQLTKSQLAEMFAAVTVTMVNEGLWDTVKKTAGQAVGAVANKAQQVGKNLTNKVTADKLNKAWTASGSPTDSEQVKQVLITAGVPENVVADVYKQMKLTDKSESLNLTVEQIIAIIQTLELKDLKALNKVVIAALEKQQKTT